MSEEWRDVPGHDGKYQASNLGRIRTRGGHIKSQRPTTNGRQYTSLNGTTRSTASIVCLTFNGPKPTPKHEADHIDDDKTNNRADNLRWLTKKENIQKQHSVPITLLHIESGVEHQFDSHRRAAAHIGVTYPMVSYLKSGKVQQCRGWSLA